MLTDWLLLVVCYLSDKFDFHMIGDLSIVAHAFTSCILVIFSRWDTASEMCEFVH